MEGVVEREGEGEGEGEKNTWYVRTHAICVLLMYKLLDFIMPEKCQNCKNTSKANLRNSFADFINLNISMESYEGV